ncbi:MAG: DNA adenine methylase [Bacteroidales bacterium]|nr:DNA adenine methylase [Bacteroidales bacterium]
MKINGAKPFIKWAGGKSQLLEEIGKNLPPNFSNLINIYVEPFIGGGATLFWMLQKYPNIKHAYINDINEKLINLYTIVKYDVENLIELLKKLESQYIPFNHEDRTKFFLEKRNEFNNQDNDALKQAALFIFINRTCFNGLYRENSKGKFNVPHGKYSNPQICDEVTLRADSDILQRVEIQCGDFAKTLDFATENTLYYLDPPYKPLSDTSSFNSYVKESFNDNEQIRLRDFCNIISERGAKFILSNSDVKGKDPENDFFDELYQNFNIRRVLATRMVNANPEKRGKLSELMISNIEQLNVEEIPTLF